MIIMRNILRYNVIHGGYLHIGILIVIITITIVGIGLLCSCVSPSSKNITLILNSLLGSHTEKKILGLLIFF